MHRMLNRRTLVASALALPVSTWAATWPTRPLRIVLPFAAGGSSDLVARLLADKLGQTLGSPRSGGVRRAGANGIIARRRWRAAQTGIPSCGSARPMPSMPSLYPRLPYDSQRDFAPVALVASPGPMVVAVPAALPVRNVPDLIALARRKPGQVSYASAGIGNVLHLAGEMLGQQPECSSCMCLTKALRPPLTTWRRGKSI